MTIIKDIASPATIPPSQRDYIVLEGTQFRVVSDRAQTASDGTVLTAGQPIEGYTYDSTGNRVPVVNGLLTVGSNGRAEMVGITTLGIWIRIEEVYAPPPLVINEAPLIEFLPAPGDGGWTIELTSTGEYVPLIFVAYNMGIPVFRTARPQEIAAGHGLPGAVNSLPSGVRPPLPVVGGGGTGPVIVHTPTNPIII